MSFALCETLLFETCTVQGLLRLVWWCSICTFYIMLKANDSISVKVLHFLFIHIFAFWDRRGSWVNVILTLPCLMFLRHLMLIFFCVCNYCFWLILEMQKEKKRFKYLPWYLKLSLVLPLNSSMIIIACLSGLASEKVR